MSELVTVEAYSTPTEAEVDRTFLEREGVRAYVADAEILAMDWLLGAAVGGVKLQVAAADVQRARELLQSLRAERQAKESKLPDIEFTCEDCNELIRFPGKRAGGVESCPKCNAYVDVPEIEASAAETPEIDKPEQ